MGGGVTSPVIPEWHGCCSPLPPGDGSNVEDKLHTIIRCQERIVSLKNTELSLKTVRNGLTVRFNDLTDFYFQLHVYCNSFTNDPSTDLFTTEEMTALVTASLSQSVIVVMC